MSVAIHHHPLTIRGRMARSQSDPSWIRNRSPTYIRYLPYNAPTSPVYVSQYLPTSCCVSILHEIKWQNMNNWNVSCLPVALPLCVSLTLSTNSNGLGSSCSQAVKTISGGALSWHEIIPFVFSVDLAIIIIYKVCVWHWTMGSDSAIRCGGRVLQLVSCLCVQFHGVNEENRASCGKSIVYLCGTRYLFQSLGQITIIKCWKV